MFNDERKIKFVYVSRDQKDIKVIDAEIAMQELLQHFKEFCLSIGFHPNTVEEIQMVEKEDDVVDDE